MDKKGIKKIIVIIFLAALMIWFASLLPDYIVGNYMVPIIFGVLFSSAVGKAPDLLINQIMHVFVFLPLFILHVYLLTLSAGFAYVAGVLIQKSLYKVTGINIFYQTD